MLYECHVNLRNGEYIESYQSCPRVEFTHGLGWVGLGWAARKKVTNLAGWVGLSYWRFGLGWVKIWAGWFGLAPREIR